MSNSIESQGKTVEEALSEALLKLGARRDEVRVTVLDEGKAGFLGMIGGRRARVRVERKDPAGQRGGRGRPGGVAAIGRPPAAAFPRIHKGARAIAGGGIAAGEQQRRDHCRSDAPARIAAAERQRPDRPPRAGH
jgi:spoIIIJ-associated protein